MSIGAAKLSHNESSKDNESSAAMQITVVWFCRVHLCVFLHLSNIDSPDLLDKLEAFIFRE